MFEREYSIDHLDEIEEYSHANISLDEFDLKLLKPSIIMNLAETLANHTIDPEFYDKGDLLDNKVFREKLFLQLKPILSYFYNLKGSQLNDDIFMIELFEDDALDQLSEFKKDKLLMSFADEFQSQLEFVKQEGIRMTKNDLKDILFACFYEVEYEAREFFGYDKTEYTMQLQSVFLN